jgi:hypothetical protein
MKLFIICMLCLGVFQLEAMKKREETVELLPTSRAFQESCSAVWTPTMQAMVRHDFMPTLSDKETGIASFKYIGTIKSPTSTFGIVGQWTVADIKHYAVLPHLKRGDWLQTWRILRLDGASVSVLPEGQRCRVKLGLDMSAFESNVFKTWVKVDSNGTIESGILDDLQDHGQIRPVDK